MAHFNDNLDKFGLSTSKVNCPPKFLHIFSIIYYVSQIQQFKVLVLILYADTLF